MIMTVWGRRMTVRTLDVIPYTEVYIGLRITVK